MPKPKTHVVGSNLIEKDGKILLMQETLKKVRGKWNFPAGKLDLKEDIISCAAREAEEETGFKVKPEYLVGIYQHHLTLSDNVVLFVFKSKIIGGKLKIPAEAMDVRWFSYKEIQEMNKKGLLRNPYILKAIKDYRAGKKIALSLLNVMD